MIRRLVIATGGTGGHIYPAIALADYLKEKDSEVDILFVGTKRMESGLIPNAGYKFKSIYIKGFDRDVSLGAFLKNLVNLAGLLTGISLIQSYKILKEFRPQVILGAGGYPCGPVILTGYMMGIPGAIMEQNVIPGFTNKILARFVEGAALGFETSDGAFRKIKHREVTGTPVRKEIIKAKREEGIRFFDIDPAKKTLLVFGGSLGSRNINLRFVEALKNLERNFPDTPDKLQVIHSTGKRDYSHILKEMEGLRTDYRVYEYIDRMHYAYSTADLVIQRAGGVSLAEVCCRGLPSIVIPWKGSANNHQMKNAEYLLKKEAAVMISDEELNSEILAEKIAEFLFDEEKLKTLAENSRGLGKPDASSRVAELLEKISRS